MEKPEGRGFGTLSFDTSEDPEAWGLAYFDVFLGNRVLSSLSWKRWFVGLAGPRCVKAASLLDALEYVFGVSAVIGFAKPEFELASIYPESIQGISDEVRNRVEGIQKADMSFPNLYSDLLAIVCVEANLAASTVATAMESESGRELLRGTKVPKGAALRMALQIARQGFVFGQTYSDEARSLVTSTEAFGASVQIEAASAEQHVESLVTAWETQGAA